MRICYCEDEAAQSSLLKKQIKHWAKLRKITCDVDLFESAEEFLFKEEAASYDLILLDIAMKEISGMELAKRIRAQDRQVPLVFLTSDSSYVFDGYEVQALRYLMKPVQTQKLQECLDLAYETLENRDNAYVILKVDNENRRLNVHDIVYVEVTGHYVNLHLLKKEVIQQKESLQNILKLLNEREENFVICHRSFAVNLYCVEQISRMDCKLTGGESVPVSRSSYKALNEQFIRKMRQ